MLRKFFTTLALTAAITAGTNLTMSALQTQSNLLASVAEIPTQSSASTALAQISTDAAMFEKRESVLKKKDFDLVLETMNNAYLRSTSGGIAFLIVNKLNKLDV